MLASALDLTGAAAEGEEVIVAVAVATATGVPENVDGGETLEGMALRTLVLRELAQVTLGVMSLPAGIVGNEVMAAENAIPVNVQRRPAGKLKEEIKRKERPLAMLPELTHPSPKPL